MPSAVSSRSNATGTAEVAIDRIAQGKYPPRILQGMTRHLEGLRDLASGEWTSRRNFFTKAHPGAEQYVPGSDVLGAGPEQQQPNVNDLVRKYGGTAR
jgi:hypothetical protein